MSEQQNFPTDYGHDWRECQRLKAEVERLREALDEIAKGEGPYSIDPITHASNCIEAMKAIANKALEVKP